MKKNVLAAALLASIAGTAQGVDVDPGGLGEVLLFPYYSVQEGAVNTPDGEVTGSLDTLVSIVNTADDVKAVKVRILEGKNSREVLDFNLYLSPFDVWTGVIMRDPNGEGGMLKTTDTTCTVPGIPEGGVAFRNFAYTGESSDGEDTSLARTREGHLEIIEMGVVQKGTALANAATHSSLDCSQLISAWQPGGTWETTFGTTDMEAPDGGLFGRIDLVDVQFGASVGYAPTALEAFWRPLESIDPFPPGQHAPPGSVNPSLAQAFGESKVFYNGLVIESNWNNGIDAVSSVIMNQNVYNEFILDTMTRASTSWIVTFPTKSFYVNSSLPIPPFTTRFGSGGACEDAFVTVFDREETGVSPDLDFSPPRAEEGNVLCWETNVITFNEDNRLNSALTSNIDLTSVGFQNGWMSLGFTNQQNRLVSLDENVFFGLPVIGFAVNNHLNGTLEIDGVSTLGNYANLYPHKFQQLIIPQVGPTGPVE